MSVLGGQFGFSNRSEIDSRVFRWAAENQAVDILALPSSQDRFKIMGWNFNKLIIRGLTDRKLCCLIGEGLHLSSIGAILYLVFLAKGPWWQDAKGPPASTPQCAAPTAAQSEPIGKSCGPTKRRRTGCLALPPSAM
jgi:hypothetical protein